MLRHQDCPHFPMCGSRRECDEQKTTCEDGHAHTCREPARDAVEDSRPVLATFRGKTERGKMLLVALGRTFVVHRVVAADCLGDPREVEATSVWNGQRVTLPMADVEFMGPVDVG